ncbi:DUF2931 family protein [Aeromonas salmonicida]|uniref:DUF2931 family protein n=1 Tax=Aeromonas salmonicida TaxID=645 RepID=UPI0038BDA504
MKFRWISLSVLIFTLLGCSSKGMANSQNTMDWRYMVGTNADEIWSSKANFYRDGKPIHGSSSGAVSSVSKESLRDKDYSWTIGKGRSAENQPIPNEVQIEWVSYHDKKRYGITLNLPANTGTQMAQSYLISNGKKREETQRNVIAIGMASGGYVEVFLTQYNVKPDILLVRGLAHEVTDDYYDKRVPLSKQYGFDEFYQKYGAAYQQYPTPSGMAWAPIMDAYRAAQPKTDTNPVN